MPQETWPPQCHLCNRFISYKDLRRAVVWTPYGDASMDEPPPDNYAHLKCWEEADEKRRSLIVSISWAKPHSAAWEKYDARS